MRSSPEPFQSPGMGLGSNVTSTLNISHTRYMMYLDIHRWSPMSMPTHGPTWYSHCEGSTSPLTPEMLTPAAKHSLRGRTEQQQIERQNSDLPDVQGTRPISSRAEWVCCQGGA